MILSAFVAAMLAQGATAATPPAERDKLICKRREETGSLVKKRRICFTKAEWERQSASFRKEWEDLQGVRGNSRGN